MSVPPASYQVVKANIMSGLSFSHKINYVCLWFYRHLFFISGYPPSHPYSRQHPEVFKEYSMILSTIYPQRMTSFMVTLFRRLKYTKYLYPPKGTAKAVPDGVHLTVFPFYMWLVNENRLSQFCGWNPSFWKSQKPLLSGWVGGWMGGWMGGDHLGPSIFLIFKYINKQTVLIPNMVLKVVYGFYIRSYEHFNFQI